MSSDEKESVRNNSTEIEEIHKYLEEVLKREPVKIHPGQISLEI